MKATHYPDHQVAIAVVAPLALAGAHAAELVGGDSDWPVRKATVQTSDGPGAQ